jgi:hypothetical protein
LAVGVAAQNRRGVVEALEIVEQTQSGMRIEP